MLGEISVSYYKGEVEIFDGYDGIVVGIEDCGFIVNCISRAGPVVLLEDSIRGSKFILHVGASSGRLDLETELKVSDNYFKFGVQFNGQESITLLKKKLTEVIDNVQAS